MVFFLKTALLQDFKHLAIKIMRDQYGRFVKGCKIATKNKGIKKPADFGAKISTARKGIKLSDITKNKMSISKIGNKNGIGNKSHIGLVKELSPNWIEDRTKIKLDTERGGGIFGFGRERSSD